MSQKTCFVIMPFSDKDNPADNAWTDLFENVIRPAVEGAGLGYKCIRSFYPHGNFMIDIVNQLATAEVVIAVMTQLRPNVMYELGIRHALRRKTIMVVEDIREVPSDLASYIAMEYTTKTSNGREKLTETIQERLALLDAAELKSDNPVSDHLRDLAQDVCDEWHDNKNAKTFFARLINVLPSYAYRLGPVLDKVSEHIKTFNQRAEVNAQAIPPDLMQSPPHVQEEAEILAREGAALLNLRIELEPSVFFNMAHAAHKNKDYQAQLNLLNIFLDVQPDSVDGWVNHSSALNQLDKFEDAKLSAEKAIAIDPKSAGAWSMRAQALVNLGRYADAIESIERSIKLNPKSFDAWHIQAAALNLLGRHDEALTSAGNAITLNPDSAESWGAQAVALGSLGKDKDALNSANEATRLDPKSSDAWRLQGLALSRLAKYNEAIKSSNKAIELDSKSALAFCARGNIRAEMREYAEALSDLEKAIEINPKLSAAWERHGYSLFFLRKFAQARRSLKKSLEYANTDDQKCMILNNIGFSLDAEGKSPDALPYYDQAMALNPDFAHMLYNRGCALRKLGNEPEGNASIKKALLLNPQIEKIIENQKRAIAT